MKLELKHLAPYLPYGLDINIGNGFAIRQMSIVSEHKTSYNVDYGETTGTGSSGVQNSKPRIISIGIQAVINVKEDKPILRPLSDLTKEIGHEIDLSPSGALHNESPYYVFQYCFKHHFDCFNLLENGLAIAK